MLKWEPIETARVGKSEFVLARRGDEWVVRVDQQLLMSNRSHQSEISLAEHAIALAKDPRHVLVGGLGLGYTLSATLGLLRDDALVTVAELVPELVVWNRKHLHHLNDRALDDPRCEVLVGDVCELISRSRRTFDVILLDVDNGPRALSQAKNQRLYNDSGTRACWNALTPGGVLGVWSAGPNGKYAERLKRFGFEPQVLCVPARTGGRAAHVLFLGTKTDARTRGSEAPGNEPGAARASTAARRRAEGRARRRST
jgi:predicted membrane-bound spermidine synthase